MDISKASNFERFVFDLVGRDGEAVAKLWRSVAREGGFDLRGTQYLERLPRFGFVSGRSTHAARIATIRAVHARYGVVVDPHTADGLGVGLEHREEGIPLICLETALPVKFAQTIHDALGRDPSRPAGYEGLEQLPQRFTVMDADSDRVKRYIAENDRR
jgi:threonine synthase